MPPTIGSRLGHYNVTALIGEGGMGQVYWATDTKLNRQVALKILPEAFATDPDRLSRFQREAQVLASLNHPNIAQIHGIEDSEGTKALVLELVEGPTLADRIAQGPIPVDEALPIAKQIAEALEAAHEAGVIHRDLKPANIKVRDDGTVKVLDFGLAKALDPTSRGEPSAAPTLTAAATQMGVIMGTAAYMSPEQARGQTVNTQTDIWAFGCVFYEMLTGSTAFGAATASDSVARVLTHEPNWSALPAATPPEVRRVMWRTLQKPQAQRFRHIGDTLLDLQDVGREHPAVGEPEAKSDGPPRTVKRFTLAIPGDALRLTERATTSAGSEGTVLALARDGSALAYVARDTINVRPLEQVKARPVPGTEGGKSPCFSPDATNLAFVDRRGNLKVVQLATGIPETVVESVSPIGLSWTDGDSIIYGAYKGPLHLIHKTGGEPRPVNVTDSPEFFGWYWPDVLPGGRAVLFSGTGDPVSTENKVSVFNFDTRQISILADGNFPRYSPTGHVVFARGAELWALGFNADALDVTSPPVRVLTGVAHSLWSGLTQFALSTDGTLGFVPTVAQAEERRLVWVDTTGSTIPATTGLASYQHPRLSGDGNRAAVSIVDRAGVEQIWVLDLVRGSRTRITAEGSVNRWPVWTPDGQRLVFCSSRDGVTMGLFEKRSDGRGETRLLLTPRDIEGEYAVPVSWSRDGGFLAFYLGTSAGPRNLWFLSDDGTPREVLATSFDDRSPSLSPDGRWLAYVSDESGEDEVYVLPTEKGGQRVTVSPSGGTEPVWSSDAARLFYRCRDDLMAVDFNTTSGPSGVPRLVVGKRGDLLRTPQANPNYDVTPDGSRFLMVQKADDDAGLVDLQLVLNWDRELTKRIPT